MKIDKKIILLSIVIISLLALGAVSATEDVALDDADTSVAIDEVQAIDSAVTNDDISYGSDEIIVNTTGDSSDLSSLSQTKTNLGASKLTAGETKSFTQLVQDISNNPAMLSGVYYKYDSDTDSEYVNGIALSDGLVVIANGATIDGNNLARLFVIPEGVSVTLSDLNLINGFADEGAAIYNSGKLTLMSSNVSDNTAVKSGGAIYNNGGEVLVTSSELKDNDLTNRTVNGWGGAAIYSQGGTVTITNTNITDNLKDIVHRGGTGTYTGDLSSAAVTSKGASLTVTNSYLAKNSGSYGGAILAQGGTLLVSGTTFENNFAFNGGAIDIVNAGYTITGSHFYNNNVKGTGSTNTNYACGGAICAQDSSNQGTISGCDFEGNTATIGGAIMSENTIVDGCTFKNNYADSTNSETFNGKTNNKGGFAGAIYNDGTITISESTFSDNVGRGEGIRVKTAEISDSSFTNTVIYSSNSNNIELTNNTYDNSAKDVSASNAKVIVNIGEGDIPNTSSRTTTFVGDFTFQGLQDIIDSGSSNIHLTGDVIKTTEEETTFADGLRINSNVIIYGAEGKVIKASRGKIFNVAEGKTLSLYDATLEGSGETAIVNYGKVQLSIKSPSTFINCGDILIDNYGTLYESGLTTFTQLNNLIGLVNGGTLSIGSSKINKTEEEKETFKSGILIDKDLSILGSLSSKKVATYLDAKNDGKIFTIAEGKSLSIKYINLTNAKSDDGAGVYVSQGASLIADSSNFLNNVATYSGGAIYATDAIVSLNNCTLDANDVTDVSKNNHTGGAAIHTIGSQLTITNTNITNNANNNLDRTKGDLVNGVVNLLNSVTTIRDSVFENNTGIYGGAITAISNVENTKLTVVASNFTNNKAYAGGAIYVWGNNTSIDLDVSDSLFDSNNAIGSGSTGYIAAGGAISTINANSIIDNSTFKNNHASYAAAISSEDSNFAIEDSNFEKNIAENYAGAIQASRTSELIIKNSNFTENNAKIGIIVTTGAASVDASGIISANEVDTSSYGVIAVFGTGDVTVEDSKFTKDVIGNTTSIYSGSDADVTVKDSTFDTNSNYAIFVTKGDLTLSGNDISSALPYSVYVSANADIVSKIIATVAKNRTYNAHLQEYYFDTILADDNGNFIRDAGFKTVIYKDGVEYAAETATFYGNPLYRTYFTFTEPGTYVVSLDYSVEEVKTATYNVYATFTDLKNLIDNDDDGVIDLTVDYIYNSIFDGVLTDGIEITKDVTINGNGKTISGNGLARIFNVSSVGALSLDNVVLANGKANPGAAIFSEGKLKVNHTTFIENHAGMTDGEGGAISIWAGETVIDNSEFINNSAWLGGAIESFSYNGDKATIVNNSKFYNNTAMQGAGIFNQYVELTVDNSVFDGNEVVGQAPAYYAWASGAHIYSDGKSTTNVLNSNFTNGKSEFNGAAIYIQPSAGYDATIEGCRFEDNTANSYYGAVYYSGTGSLTVKDSKFYNNTAKSGDYKASGALYFYGNVLTVEDVEFINNTAPVAGGAMVFNGNTLALTRGTFIDNKADKGGAIYINRGSATIADSKFTGNDPEYGGAIYVAAGELIVKENTEFTKNTADLGGAVYVASGATFTADNVKFTENTATQSGGAIYAQDNAVVNIKDSEFTSNKATGTESFPSAGAVYIGDASANITGSTFANNEGAGSAGAVYIGADNAVISGSSFIGNKALACSAGALWVNGYTAIVSDCTFTENEAGAGFGGAIEWRVKEGSLSGSSFTSNKAAQGGAVHWYGADGTIEGVIFTGNEATNNGGAIFWEGASGTVSGTKFTSNKAGEHGNAIYWAGAKGTVDDSIVTSNTGGAGAIIWLGSEGTVKNSHFSENGNNLAVFNIYKLADDLKIESNTFDISLATISADKESYVYGENVSVSGEFYWGVNDYPITLNISATKDLSAIDNWNVENFENVAFLFTKELLNAGTYSASIENFTEDAYGNRFVLKTDAIVNFVIDKANVTLTIDVPEQIKHGDDAQAIINLADNNGIGLNENVKLIINDVLDSEVETVEGINVTDVSELEAGRYFALVIFEETENYNYAINYTLFTVTKDISLTVNIEDVIYDDDALIEVKLYDGETGLTEVVFVTINETTYKVAVVDGMGNLKVSGLEIGQYDYNASYRGDEIYNAFTTENAVFNVNKNDQSVLDLSADNEIVDGKTLDITATLTDGTGSPIEGASLSYSIDGGEAITATGLTDSEGKLIISVGDLAYSEHTIVVNFDDDYYASASGSINVKVTPKKGSYTYLQYLIDNAGDELVLEVPIIFDEVYDLANNPDFINGVVINKDISIIGNGLSIRGNDKARIFNIKDGASVYLEDLGLYDGLADNGSAVYLESGTSLYLFKVYVENNIAKYAGAIYSLGDLEVHESVFESNEVTAAGPTYGGAAICAGEKSELSVYDTEFNRNNANSVWSTAGAIYVNGAESMIVDNCDFNNNFGTMGAAVCIEKFVADGVIISDSRFNENNAIQGGAIFINKDVTGTIGISESSFDANYVSGQFTDTATAFGGAIWVGSSDDLKLEIVGTNCTGNYNDDGTYAGLIYIARNVDLTMADVEVTSTKGSRGLILVDGNNDVIFDNVKFINNEVVYGTILVGSGSNVVISNSEFRDNNGFANYYNIWNAGGTVSIENTKFYTITPTVTMDDSFVYGVDVSFNGTFDWGYIAALDMQYSVDGADATTTVTAGKFSKDLGNEFDVGTHTVVIKSFTDANGNYYDVNDVIFTFEVTKASPVLEVGGDEDLMPGDDATISIALTGVANEGIEGIVIVTVDGKDYVAYTDEDGEAELTISGLAAKTYPIVAKFVTNDNYVSVENNDAEISFMFEVAYFDIVITNGTYGEELTVTVENVTDSEGNPLTGTVSGGINNKDGDLVGQLDIQVVGGSGTETIIVSEAGLLDVTAYFMNEYDYKSDIKAFEIYVAKAQPAVAVTYDGDEFTITLDGVNGEKLNETVAVEIDGVAASPIVTENGTKTFANSDLSVGNHSVYVKFDGNGNYLADSDYITFNIVKGTSAIGIAAEEEYVYGPDANIVLNVTGKNDALINKGILYITVGEITKVFNLSDANPINAAIALDGFAAGQYELTAVFSGNDDYESSRATVLINVTKAVPTITVTGVEVGFGEPATVTVTVKDGDAGISGIAVVTVDGVDYAVYVSEGTGQTVIKGLSNGTYVINAKFIENENYAEANAISSELTVKASTEATLDVAVPSEDPKYGGDVVINVAANDGAGNVVDLDAVNVTVNGETKEYTVTADGNVNLGPMAVGDNNITVSFDDGVHTAPAKDVAVKVVPADASIDVAAPEDLKYGDDVVINVALKDGSGDELDVDAVNVTVNGVTKEYPVDNDGNVNLGPLAVGNHVAEITFINPNYEIATKTIHFVVEKAVPTITVTGDEVEFGEPATVTVTVKDGATGISGIVIVTVNGVDYAVTITGGTGSVDISGLPFDEYPISAKFVTNDNYESVDYAGDANVIVNMPKTLNVDLAIEDDFSEVIVENVTDAAGAPVNGNISGELFKDGQKIDNLTSNTLEDGEGTIALPADLTYGNYTVKITVMSDEGAFTSKDIEFIIPKLTMDFNYAIPEVVYRDDLVVEITDAIDEEDNPVSGNVTVYYYDDAGEYRSAVGNVIYGSGEVKLTDLNASSYELFIVFNNDDYDVDGIYAVGVVNKAIPDLTVDVESISCGEKPTIDIELRGYHGEYIDEDIVVSINNEEIGNYTTTNGKVSVPVDNIYGVGNYTVSVVFASNDNYLHVTELAVFEVTKAIPTITVAPTKDEFDYGEEVTVAVTVKDGDVDVSGIAVVTVDGVDYAVYVSEGTGQTVIKGLSNGTYGVNAKFIENENYAEANAVQSEITVKASTEATLDVAVPSEAPKYGDDVVINVAAKDGAGNVVDLDAVNVTVNGETKEYTVTADGNVNLGPMAVGDNNITVSFDDGVHTAPAKDVAVKVVPADASIDVAAPEDPKYGDDVVINVVLKDGSGDELDVGTVNVTVNGVTKEYPVDNDGNVNLGPLAVGDNNITVSFDNGVYDVAPKDILIMVDPSNDATIDVNITPKAPEYGDSPVATVTVADKEGTPLDGKVSVSVDGNLIGYEDLVNGSATISLDDLTVGDHNVEIVYVNDNYTDDVVARKSLTVAKAGGVKLSVNPTDIKEGEVETIAVSLTAADGTALDGIVILTIDGTDYAANVSGGKATVSIKNLDADDYTIGAKFIGDDKYDVATAKANFEVTGYSNVLIDITAGDEEIEITVTDEDGNPINTTVNVTVGTESMEIPVVDGKATIPASEGTKNVTVAYPGDGKYAPSAKTKEVVITKEIIFTDLAIKLSAENIIYGDKNITATLDLTAGGKAIDGVVELSINGELQNVTVRGGKATVPINDVAAGNYTVVANYAGTNIYTEATDSANFNVARKATSFNYENMKTTAVYVPHDGRIGEYFYFQLVDADGNPVADKNVSIGFNGKVYNRTTNATGWAKLQINLGIIFRYTFAISFLGDENYTAAFNVALIEVSAQTPKLTTSSKTYKASAKTKSLTATFTTSSGNPVKSKKITFTVNGKSYSAYTNAKGVATVKVSLSKKGTYSFTAKFAGDNTYAAISKSAKLTIK